MSLRARLTFAAFAAATLIPAAGCSLGQSGPAGKKTVGPFLPDLAARAKGGGPSTPEQDALLRVLDENKQHFKAGFDSLEVDAQPSAVTKMLAAYAALAEKIDLGGCPMEFQAAFVRHVKAWKHLQEMLKRLPDAYEDVEFTTALYGLFGGSEVRGRILGGDVIKAVHKVNATFAEMYGCAEGYGIEVDRSK